MTADDLNSLEKRLRREIGAKLRAIRKATPGLTLSAIASKMGVTYQQLDHLEAGRRPLRLSYLQAFADATSRKLLVDFVVPADEPPPSPPALTLARLYDSLPEPDRAAVERVAATLPQLPDEIRTTVRDGLIEEMDRWLRRHGRAEKAG